VLGEEQTGSQRPAERRGDGHRLVCETLPAPRATSALFLQEIKYFCVARQTKWRCQREGRAGAGVQTQNDSGGKNCAMFTKFCSEKVEK